MRKVIHTRHVLAINDLSVSTIYIKDKLGLDLGFTAPRWEFLSFGEFKLMLGVCAEAL